MSKRLKLAAAALAVAAVGGSAAANDSSAEMTTGGLVLKNSRNIDMLEEDLYVSAEQVLVSYVFRNQGRRDERVIVAFPMPDRQLELEYESDVGVVEDFHTEVEGRPVQMQVERKAMIGATDHSALLTRLGIPLAPEPGTWEEVLARYDRLPAADQQRLRRAGLVDIEGEGDQRFLRLTWTLKETYYWTQVFPAGRELRIRHRYKPGTGGSAGALLANPQYRSGNAARQQIRDYCADPAFLAGAERLYRQAAGNGEPMELRFGYILRTGGNWRSPIRNFRMVVDKGDPRNIVSFCADGVRRISPTQFEVRRTNWRPDRDLHVLLIKPWQAYSE